MDTELRDALERLAADLRDEIRSGDAETRAYVDQRIGASEAGMRAYMDERFGASEAGMRAYIDERFGASGAETRGHFDVVGESLHGEIRSLAELMAIWIERTDGRIGEQTGRADGLRTRRRSRNGSMISRISAIVGTPTVPRKTDSGHLKIRSR